MSPWATSSVVGLLSSVLSHPSVAAHRVDSTFVGNEAADFGGAFFAQFSAVNVRVGCVTRCPCGCCCCVHSYVPSSQATSTTFTHNSVLGTTTGSASGGAVFATGDRPVTISKCTFSANTASVNAAVATGGALSASSCAPVITGSEFHANTARTGGAVYLAERSVGRIMDSQFHRNVAAAAGGAVAVSTAVAVDLLNVTLGSNAATNGGGVALDALLTGATFVDTRFLNNVAQNTGGGLLVQSTDVTGHNVTFGGNTASTGGGGVFWSLASPPVLHPPLAALGTCTTGADTACDAAGNCAAYGCGQGTPVAQLMVQHDTPAATDTVQPGQQLPVVRVLLVDALGSVVRSDSVSTVRAQLLATPGDATAVLSGSTSAFAEAGVASFSDLRVSAAPGVTVAIVFELPLAQSVPATAPLHVSVTHCGDGHFLDTTLPQALSCRQCAPGTAHKGAPGAVDGCSACPSGSVAPAAGSTSCTACLDGEQVESAAAPCVPCAPGSARHAATQSACEQCGSGTVAPLPGATECVECGAGTHQTGRGETQCAPCDPGFFAAGNGSHTCAQCSEGFIAPGFGSTACDRCQPGQHQASRGQSACRPCPVGSFTSDGVECVQCPFGVACSGGVASLVSGFWTAGDPSNLTESTTLVPCVGGSDVCLLQNGTLACATGYTGDMCSVCEDGYAKLGSTCIKCADPAVNAILLGAVLALALAACYVLVKRSRQAKTPTSGVVRVLLNFVQLTMTVMAIELGPRGGVRQVLGTSAAASAGLDFPPLACSTHWSYAETVYAYLALPACMMALPAFVYVAIWARTPKTRSGRAVVSSEKVSPAELLASQYVATVVFLLFLVLQRTSQAFFSVFEVFPHRIRGHRVLAADLTLRVGSSAHRTLQACAAAGIAVYTVGVPAVAAALVYRQRNNLADARVRARYSFIVDGYQAPRAAVFEVAVIARKLLAAAVVAFLQSSFYRLLWATVIITAALALHLTWLPFEVPAMNRLETASLCATLGVVLCSLWASYGGATRAEQDAAAAVATVTFVSMLVAGIVCAVVGRMAPTAWMAKPQPRGTPPPLSPSKSPSPRGRMMSWKGASLTAMLQPQQQQQQPQQPPSQPLFRRASRFVAEQKHQPRRRQSSVVRAVRRGRRAPDPTTAAVQNPLFAYRSPSARRKSTLASAPPQTVRRPTRAAIVPPPSN